MPGKAKPPGPRPELLQHPNLPKPMHGLNPRTVMGQVWWDVQRKRAYAQKGFTCWACEIHKRDAKVHQWLEGHEEYDIDYAKGRMVFKRVVALCNLCHNFIHSGRLYALLDKAEITRAFFNQVLEHGFRVLTDAGLTPWSGTIEVALMMLRGRGYGKFSEKKLRVLLKEAEEGEGDTGRIAAWGKWRLVLEGKEHKPVHRDMGAWRRAYGV